MSPFHEQFAAHNSAAYTSPFGFSVANTKLDMLSDVGATFAEAGPRKPPLPPSARRAAAPPAAAAAPAPASEAAAAVPVVSLAVEGSEAAAEAAKARDFDALMDTFSLHHYIIRHGATLRHA